MNLYAVGRAMVLGISFALSGCYGDENETPIDEAAVARGSVLVRDCAACHSLSSRDNGVGPHLVEVYGREVASVRGFDYSEALAAEDFVWNSERISAFIQDPVGYVPGTKMAYGELSEGQAADIAEFFRSVEK